MCEDDRIYEMERALSLLGLEKCIYCSSWDKKSNFEIVKIDKVDGAWRTKYCCSVCQVEYRHG